MLTDLNKYNYGYKTIEEKRQKCPNIFIINPSQTLKRYLHHNIWHHKHTLLSYNTLGFIVLLTIFLVSQEFRIHAFGWHVLGPLLLLDTIGVSLVGIIMRTSVLLLHHCSSLRCVKIRCKWWRLVIYFVPPIKRDILMIYNGTHHQAASIILHLVYMLCSLLLFVVGNCNHNQDRVLMRWTIQTQMIDVHRRRIQWLEQSDDNSDAIITMVTRIRTRKRKGGRIRLVCAATKRLNLKTLLLFELIT